MSMNESNPSSTSRKNCVRAEMLLASYLIIPEGHDVMSHSCLLCRDAVLVCFANTMIINLFY